MAHIKVILGSVRPGRFGIQPAEWITKLGKQYGQGSTFELVDLKEVGLPMLDTPVPPSMMPRNQSKHQETWAKIIDEADGFIIVTAEYNHSIPASLKNAIDFLADEWAHKPVAFLGYGAEAGAARAMEHLREVAGWLKMYDISEHVLIREYYLNQNEDGVYQFNDQQEKKAQAMIEQLVFWAETMKPAREQLASK